MTFAVLAEDISDADSIASIIKLIKNDKNLTVYKKGYGGAGNLFKHGAAQIKAYNLAKDCSKFIVCYDSDGEDVEIRRKRIINEIINPANVEASYCALVPVQEIEAWFLSDFDAIRAVFGGFRNIKAIPNPEHLKDPKEHLRHHLKNIKPSPKYVNSLHNPQIAAKLNLDLVLRKCSSFAPLFELVKNGKSNLH